MTGVKYYQFMKKKFQNKILVLGGAGFIGSKFVDIAVSRNFKTTVVDCLTYASDLKRIKHLTNDIKFFKININNRKKIIDFFSKHDFDYVINFAAETHVDRSIDVSDIFVKTNINGTVNILEGLRLKRKLKNYIHISTDEVFGSLDLNDPKFCEKNKYDPQSPYSASKAAADHLVLSWYNTYGTPVIITHCCNNYGPWQLIEKFIPLSISKALTNQNIPIYGSGKNIREWIHVNDHCKALFEIMLNGKIGERYLIGSGQELCNIDLANIICDYLDEIKPKKQSYKKLIKFVKDRPGHDFRYSINSNKLKKLGWNYELNFNYGIKKTIDWYIKHEEWWKKKIKKGYNQRIGLG